MEHKAVISEGTHVVTSSSEIAIRTISLEQPLNWIAKGKEAYQKTCSKRKNYRAWIFWQGVKKTFYGISK